MITTHFSALARVSLLGLAIGNATAGDWPQWRGPDRTGVAPGAVALAETWGPAGPAKLWMSEPVPKDSLGSPVVGGDRVYLYGTSKPPAADGTADLFFCFDAADGKTVWKQAFPIGTNSAAASGTPCLANGRLFGLGAAGTVYCLDARDGKRLWAAQGKGVPSAKWGETMSSSVLVLADQVIAMAGPLTAFKADTGDILWTQEKVGPSESSPVLWRNGGRNLLICNTGKSCFCVDAKDGSILWSVAGGMFSTPVVEGDQMVLLGGNDAVGLSAYRLSAEKAELLWKVPLKDRGASPLIDGEYVYAVGGNKVVCVARADGKVAWEWTEGIKVEISSPILAGGRLIALSGGPGLAMFRAAPEKAERMAAAKLEASALTCSSPAFADGKLYLRLSKKGIACYDLRAASSPE
jgi:outer membrane protein assembly factor BamB